MNASSSAKSAALVQPASSLPLTVPVWMERYLIPVKGLSIIAGNPGEGKSTLLVHLLARASRGELDGDFLGKPVSSLLISYEDDRESVILPRLVAAGADMNLVNFLHPDAEASLALPRNISALYDAWAATPYRIVVIDPIANLLRGSDTFKDSDVRSALQPLVDFAVQTKSAVIAVMHLRKASTTNPLNAIGGSIAFAAAARSVLLFGTAPGDEDTPMRTLARAKSSHGLPVPSRRYEIVTAEVAATSGEKIETSRLRLIGESHVTAAELVGDDRPSAPSRMQVAQQFILQALSNGPVPAREITADALAAGVAEKTLQRAKDALPQVASSRTSDGSWVWSLS